jgi:beta-phosphoglucomutase-like phosphatase (HAD superfamily)
MPAPFDAVIFDNDGLLLDTEEAWSRAETVLFARRGRTFTMEHKRAIIGSSRTTGAAILEQQLDRPGEGFALMDELHDLVMEEVLKPVAPRPGAVALLERLLGAGIPVGLASNSSREFVERTLRGAGLLGGNGGPFGPHGPFATVVSADDVARPKPAPDIYEEAARRLGAAPTRCAALEDSPTGAAAGRAAGMFVVGVPYFADHPLPGVDLLAGSLADPEVAAALGL